MNSPAYALPFYCNPEEEQARRATVRLLGHYQYYAGGPEPHPLLALLATNAYITNMVEAWWCKGTPQISTTKRIVRYNQNYMVLREGATIKAFQFARVGLYKRVPGIVPDWLVDVWYRFSDDVLCVDPGDYWLGQEGLHTNKLLEVT